MWSLSPPSATWGNAVLWWQGPTWHGLGTCWEQIVSQREFKILTQYWKTNERKGILMGPKQAVGADPWSWWFLTLGNYETLMLSIIILINLYYLTMAITPDDKMSPKPAIRQLKIRMDGRGFESRQGLRIFLFTTASRTAVGPTHPSYYPMDTRGCFPGGEADHSPPSSAEVQNAWSYTSTPQYALMVWWSVKAQGQLHLSLYPNQG
jgi:hypothetical protein